MRERVVIWINGASGSGKSTTSIALKERLPDWRLYDPEVVGFVLRQFLEDRWPGDFQRWPGWRRLVVTVADELMRESGDPLIAMQAVSRRDYWDELRAGFTRADIDLRHVVLDPSESALRARIEASEEAQEWRLDHIAEYIDARGWLLPAADLVIDTSDLLPEETARRIAAWLE
jgi:AAA domain